MQNRPSYQLMQNLINPLMHEAEINTLQSFLKA